MPDPASKEREKGAYTPGPWHVYGDHVEASNGYWIADAIDNNGRAENLANAHLIAAAPELLEALRHHYNQDIPFADRQSRAWAAICKAEGRSS
jgi:hypothetical protein